MKAVNNKMSLPAGGEGRQNESILVRRVDRAIERLPRGEWEILFVSVVGKMRCEEIAATLSLPVEIVKCRIRQVRESMRSKLFSECGVSGLPEFQPAAKMNA